MRAMVVLWLAACGTSPDHEHCADVFYADVDGDGHGDAETTTTACEVPSGFTATGDDCDDDDAAVHPGASELCNTIDDDCDGSIDVAAADETTWYEDADADGFGVEVTTASCMQPSGFAATSGDCDDTNAAIHPDATEVCNLVDDDCDSLVDELDPGLSDGVTIYADTDVDGYGDPATGEPACETPSGFVTDGSDCDDTRADVHPDADEVCDKIDDDCDLLIDDEDDPVIGQSLFYADSDGDGVGETKRSVSACVLPKGYVDADGDCDDADPAVSALLTYFPDSDGDGYGLGALAASKCHPDAGDVLVEGDCRPGNPDIHPGATETCDLGDENCNGLADDDDPGVVATVWTRDSDGDGYGDDSDTAVSCDQPSGYVESGGDCDDGDSTIHPGGVEYCDALDNDCDGSADDDVVYIDWYADDDGDGFGDADDALNDCVRPTAYVGDDTDCDDAVASTHPGAIEICLNDTDDDCEGVVDNCVQSVAGVDAIVQGYEGGLGLGSALAAADFDADGITDVLCGALYASSDDGEAYVVYGPVTDTVSVGTGPVLSSTVANAYFGGVVGAGDADGDGAGDALVGTHDSIVYLFLGPVTADRRDMGADATLTGQRAYGLQVIPDTDGGGESDLLVIGQSTTFVVPGTATGDVDLLTDATYVFKEALPAAPLSSAAAAGDVDADGVADLLLGAPETTAGTAYLVEGGAGAGSYDPAVEAVATITGGVDFADRVASFDYDGDGFADLVIAASDTRAPSGDVAGAVFAYLGPLSGSLDESDATVRWESERHFGLTLGSADIDGDKQPDLLMGNPFTSSGTVYVQLGAVSGVVSDDALMQIEGQGGEALGVSIADFGEWPGEDASVIGLGAAQLDASPWSDFNSGGFYFVGADDLR